MGEMKKKVSKEAKDIYGFIMGIALGIIISMAIYVFVKTFMGCE